MKKIISSILIYALLIQTGCYSENWIAKENLKDVKGNNIRVITNDNNEYNSNQNNWFIEDDSLVISNSYYIGNEKIEQYKKIPLISIDNVYITNYDGDKSGILFFVIGVGLIIVAIASTNNIRIF